MCVVCALLASRTVFRLTRRHMQSFYLSSIKQVRMCCLREFCLFLSKQLFTFKRLIFSFVWHMCCTYLKTYMTFLTCVLFVLYSLLALFSGSFGGICSLFTCLSVKQVIMCCLREFCFFLSKQLGLFTFKRLIFSFVWHMCCTYLKTYMIFLTCVFFVLYSLLALFSGSFGGICSLFTCQALNKS